MSAVAVSVPAEREKSTLAMLTGGIIAGPLFMVVAIIQAATRDGFNIRKQAFSSLSLGDAGWIQITNFVVAGLLSLGCAIALRRALHPGPAGTWGPLLIGIFGLGQICAGIFSTDPAMGFPPVPGTPEGLPAQFTGHAIAHNISAMVAFLSASIACFVLARRFAKQRRWGWVAYSIATGIIAPSLAVSQDPSTAGIRLAMFTAMAYLWLALVLQSLKKEIKGA